jgi:hypothetical protein
MYTYHQRTGQLLEDGAPVGYGYSGAGEGRHNPDLEHVRNVGPIPRGRYRISPAFTHQTKGPIVMRLTPACHDAHKRSGFLIHGNNTANDASQGCIILARIYRKRISQADDGQRWLTVEA